MPEPLCCAPVIWYRRIPCDYNIAAELNVKPPVIWYRRIPCDYNTVELFGSHQANYNYNKHNPAIFIPPPGAAVHMYIYYIEEERHLPQKLLI